MKKKNLLAYREKKLTRKERGRCSTHFSKFLIFQGNFVRFNVPTINILMNKNYSWIVWTTVKKFNIQNFYFLHPEIQNQR